MNNTATILRHVSILGQVHLALVQFAQLLNVDRTRLTCLSDSPGSTLLRRGSHVALLVLCLPSVVHLQATMELLPTCVEQLHVCETAKHYSKMERSHKIRQKLPAVGNTTRRGNSDRDSSTCRTWRVHVRSLQILLAILYYKDNPVQYFKKQ